jgi:hypothetical protein
MSKRERDSKREASETLLAAVSQTREEEDRAEGEERERGGRSVDERPRLFVVVETRAIDAAA